MVKGHLYWDLNEQIGNKTGFKILFDSVPLKG